MPVVVGVSFRPVTKVYYFDPGVLLDLTSEEYVVVETSQGQEVGQVTWSPRAVAENLLAGDLKPVVRRATATDLLERDRFQRKEDETLALCRAKTREHRLPMIVVSAEYSYDGSRLVVSFTAEGRIDFRDLVRDLAKALNTRIEMKQIGVRDQAKVLDGVGKCGRQLCCSAWLREFNPVTIKMAKQQNLPLNPPEISGVCGRLLCCLAYEADVYEDARKQLPKVGAAVMTPEGEGRVRRIQPLRETVTVRLEDGAIKEFLASELGAKGAAGPARACSGCAMRRQPGQMAEEDEDVDPLLSALDEERFPNSAGGKAPRSKRNRNKPAGRPSVD